MGVNVQIDREERVGFVMLSGTVTGPQIISALKKLYPPLGTRDDFDVVFDCQKIVKLYVGPEDVEGFKDYVRDFGEYVPPGRTAFVLRRSLDEMVAKLFVQLARFSHRERQIVRSLEEAEEWLGRELIYKER